MDQTDVFDELNIEIERLWEIDDDVLCFVRVHGRSGGAGAPFDIRIAHLWTIRDGLVLRAQAFGDRDEALAAAGLA
jgi:ketosteroid isomerase-like protein